LTKDSKNYAVLASGGSNHYLEEMPGNDNSVLQNTKGRKVRVYVFEYEPGGLEKLRQRIEERGNIFVKPDRVIKVYGPNPGVFPYEERK
jgi:hypothetical protein